MGFRGPVTGRRTARGVLLSHRRREHPRRPLRRAVPGLRSGAYALGIDGDDTLRAPRGPCSWTSPVAPSTRSTRPSASIERSYRAARRAGRGARSRRRRRRAFARRARAGQRSRCVPRRRERARRSRARGVRCRRLRRRATPTARASPVVTIEAARAEASRGALPMARELRRHRRRPRAAPRTHGASSLPRNGGAHVGQATQVHQRVTGDDGGSRWIGSTGQSRLRCAARVGPGPARSNGATMKTRREMVSRCSRRRSRRDLVIVDETEHVIVTQFGRPTAVYTDAGLQVKAPAPFQRVTRLDKRKLFTETRPTELLTADKKNVIVAAICRGGSTTRCIPRAVRTREFAENRLTALVQSELGSALGEMPFTAIVSHGTGPRRARAARDTVQTAARDAAPTSASRSSSFGVTRLSYPAAEPPERVRAHARRARANRARLPLRGRGRGAKDPRRRRSRARRALATADADAARIRGEGEAEAARIYADAYKGHEDFYRFLRTLESYEKVLNDNTTLVLPADSPFLELLMSQRVGVRRARLRRGEGATLHEALRFGARRCCSSAGAGGLYSVEPDESAVGFVFGRAVARDVLPGIHWNPRRLSAGSSSTRPPPTSRCRWATGSSSARASRADLGPLADRRHQRRHGAPQRPVQHQEPRRLADRARAAARAAAPRRRAGAHVLSRLGQRVDAVLTTPAARADASS